MKNILIVDDSELNLYLLKRFISGDFNIIEATNGKEALEICIEKEIDLVFMDIMMPVMNGIDSTIKIKKIKTNLPIIAISAYLDSDLQKLDCFDDKLSKPIQIYEINEIIEKYLV